MLGKDVKYTKTAVGNGQQLLNFHIWSPQELNVSFPQSSGHTTVVSKGTWVIPNPDTETTILYV